jgi:hypothetical protein
LTAASTIDDSPERTSSPLLPVPPIRSDATDPRKASSSPPSIVVDVPQPAATIAPSSSPSSRDDPSL